MRKALVILAVVAIAGAAAAQDLIITEFMYHDDNDGKGAVLAHTHHSQGHEDAVQTKYNVQSSPSSGY